MRKIQIFLVGGLIGIMLLGCQPDIKIKPVQVIPQPNSIIEKQEAPFILSKKSRIVLADESMLPVAQLLQKVLKIDLSIVVEKNVEVKKGDFNFVYDAGIDSVTDEGYLLNISKSGVLVSAKDPAGLFYAVETIRQLLPVELEIQTIDDIALPALQITDSPRFLWRGMHLDVSRHFMPLEFVKKYIDYLAMYKLNVFHWHLVDGIGWRIEIKSHPGLTDIGAWRVVKEGKKPWQDYEVWREGDNRPKYGGFYTQEEIKEVVAYAKERFITVLPEIELPGHSEVVFQCFPDLVCKDKNHNHLKNIGVYCASNPDSYKLLEEILDEVLELFPSEYIHIGGDEVNKRNWEQCVDCRKLMKKNDYTPHELQSHFVNHFDEYLKAKGRKLIGWHEILEGELSESATIMYWGGENGVSGNLKKGHPMVLTTGSHLYFDHYQSLSKREPKAFGGYASLKKVYNYRPVPEDLEQKYKDLVFGVQANVWTEYMPNPERVEYMTMPRMAALSEIAWQKEGTKNWDRFRVKMDEMIRRYQAMNINYAPSAFRPGIQFELDGESKKLKVSLETELIADIYYTIDGSKPIVGVSEKYAEPFVLEKSTTVKALAVKDGKAIVEPETKEAILHKARGAKVTVSPKPTGKYSAQGGYTLVDTDFGGDKWGNGKWLGMLGTDFTTTIEFDEPTEVSKIGFNCIEETAAGIYFPAGLEVAGSSDGVIFNTLKSWRTERETPILRSSDIQTKNFELDFEPTTCKYLKIKSFYQRVPNSGVFIFVDEIIVD
jgi:hexosaminidase